MDCFSVCTHEDIVCIMGQRTRNARDKVLRYSRVVCVESPSVA